MTRPPFESHSGEATETPAPAAAAAGGATCHHLALLEALDVAVVVQDRDLHIVYANAKAATLLGITTSEITSRTTVDARWDVISPDGRPVPDDAHPGSRALRTGHAVRGVVLGVRRAASQERVWILASAVPQHGADGTVERVVISFSDVSVAQRTLRAHEAIYQAVFRSMGEGLVVHNTDGSIRAANASAERVLGLSVEQMSGRHPMDPSWRLILADGQPAKGEHIPSEITTRTGTSSQALLGVHRPNGELAWLDVHATPLYEPGDDTMHGVLATFADVTAERNALAQLEDSRAQLQRILDAVPGVVYQYVHGPGRTGRFTFAAGRIEELSGYDADAVRRDPQLLFQLLEPEHADRIWREVDETASAQKPFETVLPFHTRQGEARWARICGVPRDTDDGVIYTGVILDATREQLMADALRRSQRREAMGDMAGGIAHNFNNMLAVILPNVQLAREQADGELAQHLADAERAAVSARDLVKRMLALGRVESRGDVQVDLVPVMREALHICRQTFDRAITIRDDITMATAYVRASASSMQQVILNLLLNARDAVQGAPTTDLDVSLEEAAGPTGARQARITIRDSGMGMSADTLRHIGEPFFTTKAPGYGTGLGLASAFHSVAEAGGTWRVQSEPDRGTTFIIDIPLVPPLVAPSTSMSASATPVLSGTVLIVDDEPMVRAVLARQMTHAGMSPLLASGAAEALAMLRDPATPRPAVILLDLSMPGMSGEQAVPHLLDAAPAVPIIALSGHVRESLELPGVSAVLQKPMGQSELIEAVRQAVGST